MASTRSQRQTTNHQLTTTATSPYATPFLRRLHKTYPQSSHLIGFLTIAVSASILLFTGFTLIAIVLVAPIIVITSPFWLPIAIFVFFPIVAFLSFCGFGVAGLVALSWFYRYYRGLNPPGSDRFYNARYRIATTAREVKDYAKDNYGGYLSS